MVQINKIKSKIGPLWFLLKFFLSYGLLFFVYSYFLNSTTQSEPSFACDPITERVAIDSSKLIDLIGYESYTRQSTYGLSFDLFIEGRLIARVIEGCNAVSIMLLFIAFMIAFSNKWKTTVLYTIFGLGVLYLVNISRIAALSIGLYKVPQYGTILHELVFPAVLYGVTLSLWIYWIKKYAPKPQSNEVEN